MAESNIPLRPAPIPTYGSDYKIVYSNASRTRLTPWDITLIFSQLSEGPNATEVNNALVGVSMSPQHFKVIVESLKNALAAYEQAFGVINVRPELFSSPTAFVEAIAKKMKVEVTPTPPAS